MNYHGKPSHAAGFPWEGVNALDAVVLGYVNIAALRQQLHPSWRVHGKNICILINAAMCYI